MGVFFSSPKHYDEVGLVTPDEIFKYFGDKFYGKGTEFWENVDETDNGMLDGYLETSSPDLKFSREILNSYLKKGKMGTNRCAELGAGIGRISLNVLSDIFKEIDLVEPVSKFLDVASKNLEGKVIIHTHAVGAQDWEIEEDSGFDCIWIQWTLMYLTDEDVIQLLNKCKRHLSKSGYVFIQENILLDPKTQQWAQWNPRDHSLCRSLEMVRKLINRTEFTIIKERKQPNWGTDLIPLYLMVLK